MVSFELTTPERIAFQSEAVSVSLPTADGEITVLQHHIPLLTVLAPGMVTVRYADGTEEYLAVGGGFAQVSSFALSHAAEASDKQAGTTRIIVLADSADRSEELSVEAVEAARVRAHKALKEAHRGEETTYAALAAVLEREMARLKVAYKRRRH